MKIKNKLTLIFTLIISVILICLNIYIYLITQANTKNNFYVQLKDRAIISATVFLEADEKSNRTIKPFEAKFMQSLPKEVIRIYNSKNERMYIDSTDDFSFSQKLIDKIRTQKEVRFRRKERQVVGIDYQDNQGEFVIIVSAVDLQGMKNMSELRTVLLIGLLICLVIVFIAGRYFTKLMFLPITDISNQANKISQSNLHLRLNEGNGKDELSELTIVINRMLARLEEAFELQKNFVSNASHELRTPLTSIIGNIEVTLTRARTIEEHKEVLAVVLYEAEKLQRLTNGLLSLAQSNLDFANLHKEEIRVDDVLMDIKSSMKTKFPSTHIKIDFSKMPSDSAAITTIGERYLIETALLNIVDNACKFSNGKEVEIKLEPENELIKISIIDAGIGVEMIEIPHIKETFYRAPNARSFAGSGIGLALADKIISMHGGTISIQSIINSGTVVIIKLQNLNKPSQF
jgi:signal transduction histidine kinase